jgi:hypothetical protein
MIGNKKILERISQDELKHYNFWKDYTQNQGQTELFLSLAVLSDRQNFLGSFRHPTDGRGGEKDAQILYQNNCSEYSRSSTASLTTKISMNGNCIDIIDEEIIKIYRLIRTGSQ